MMEKNDLTLWRLNFDKTFEENTEENSVHKFRENSLKVKPPKLIISKLEDTDLEWLRFWRNRNRSHWYNNRK